MSNDPTVQPGVQDLFAAGRASAAPPQLAGPSLAKPAPAAASTATPARPAGMTTRDKRLGAAAVLFVGACVGGDAILEEGVSTTVLVWIGVVFALLGLGVWAASKTTPVATTQVDPVARDAVERFEHSDRKLTDIAQFAITLGSSQRYQPASYRKLNRRENLLLTGPCIGVGAGAALKYVGASHGVTVDGGVVVGVIATVAVGAWWFQHRGEGI
ncbi:MAG: hypothetical protein AAGC46_11985 [Solirubrobacteraceae bacterium]|nr:hypothetical protein [Patulibacter sp.]